VSGQLLSKDAAGIRPEREPKGETPAGQVCWNSRLDNVVYPDGLAGHERGIVGVKRANS